MNGRRLFRDYAKHLGKEAKEFVEIIPDFYNQDTLVTKDNKGNREETRISYKKMIYWIIKTYKNEKN